MTTQVLASASGGALGADGDEIARILAEPRSKEYKDLRDRAAYMFITGTYPSHLRTFFTRALSVISKLHNAPVSLDGRSGNLQVDPVIAGKLELDTHPMVVKVRQYIKDGWRIQVSRGANERKPYTKVFMFHRRGDHVTVQIDGSVLDHWE